jgi:hypothetical protein
VFLCTSVSDLTGRSKVKMVEDKGEKASATTLACSSFRAGVVELDDDGRT